jgi:hypothetical protein
VIQTAKKKLETSHIRDNALEVTGDINISKVFRTLLWESLVIYTFQKDLGPKIIPVTFRYGSAVM